MVEMRRYLCRVFDEWIEVPISIHRTWLGVRATLIEEKKETVLMGKWTIRAQDADYGEFVKITLTDKIEVQIKQPNPLGLVFEIDRALPGQEDITDTRILDVTPTTANADKLGFALAQLFEQVATLTAKPRARALIELPPAALGPSEGIDGPDDYDLDIEDIGESAYAKTIIRPHAEPDYREDAVGS